MSKFWDTDIEEINISDLEKNGIQVYRNYASAIERWREKEFAKRHNETKNEFTSLCGVLDIICFDDKRIVPIVFSSFCDAALKDMFERHVPQGVPGGKSSLFGANGPLSTLSSRIRLAYAFDLINKDILVDIDRIRKIRNNIAHQWDWGVVNDYILTPHFNDMMKVEDVVCCEDKFLKNIDSDIDLLQKFRIRLVWLASRMAYESAYYADAKRERLDPSRALYGVNHPDALEVISGLAINYTHAIMTGDFIYSKI
jgi:DNA-binding MltR family transcriptional regulator